MRQFALFCVAGVFGFVVDAGLVQALVTLGGQDPYLSRVASFLCAMTTTWLFNRRYTFVAGREAGLVTEWTRYALAMLGGFAVNYGVYAAMVHTLPVVQVWPVLGVAAGSVAGLFVNYLSSRHWVFRVRSG
ncbi:MAG: GtrA family protein [Chiayiivirga sp.]|jgi:putative flippase GtrA|uniref:GtrA family protein n=1 Tax=Chiayiivirga sp. TaxID=2041042 RepID=UPI0025BDC125|nr:GtrA family protein [Chiayiivirga sp.]MCI1709646.1 GtrA family protein [Chiayiivirga sp.]MCI1730066.1 GtrA family protein [Chiayiivirga sp.]